MERRFPVVIAGLGRQRLFHLHVTRTEYDGLGPPLLVLLRREIVSSAFDLATKDRATSPFKGRSLCGCRTTTRTDHPQGPGIHAAASIEIEADSHGHVRSLRPDIDGPAISNPQSNGLCRLFRKRLQSRIGLTNWLYLAFRDASADDRVRAGILGHLLKRGSARSLCFELG